MTINYYAHSPVDDPQGPAAGKRHVLRGGGFSTPIVSLRSANRRDAARTYRDYASGFRVVCER